MLFMLMMGFRGLGIYIFFFYCLIEVKLKFFGDKISFFIVFDKELLIYFLGFIFFNSIGRVWYC